MEKRARYIKKIEIDNLWDRLTVNWNLNPNVNILAGINGIGKTTILNRLIKVLEENDNYDITRPSTGIDGVHITYEPSSSNFLPYNVIRSYDRPLMLKDVVQKVDPFINSELDWQLYVLQRRYLDYQVNLGNRMVELLGNPDENSREKALQIAANKIKFQNIIDNLFEYTGKKLDRTKNDIVFLQGDIELKPYNLSSGEKQILLIYLTVLVQDCQNYLLIMDEPEASLHIDWQQKLITTIRDLNPNVQIIMTTHSPAVIMEGWVDSVTEVSDICTLKEQ